MQTKKLTFIATLLLSSSLLFGQTLVTVNGHTITDEIIPPGYEKLDEAQKSNLMEQLIKEEVLHANLLKSSLVNDPKFAEVFTQQKELIQKQYQSKTGKPLNKEQIRGIKGAIAVSLYQQKEFQKANISATEIKDFYDNNKDKFKYQNSIEIANIIVQKKSEADALLKSLRASTNLEQDFIAQANQLKQNGYMGWFTRDNAPKNLFDKAYKYKRKRLLNAPVKTKHGFNVVYLLNKKPAGQLSFSKAKKKIEQMLKQKKVMEALQAKVENLYGQAEIVY